MRFALLLLCLAVRLNSEITEEKDIIKEGMLMKPFADHQPIEDEVPLTIPRMSKQEKWALIRASGRDPESRRNNHKRVHRKRELLLAPWRITHVAPKRKEVIRPTSPPIALGIGNCPEKFDAVTKGLNGRTYVFASERVYQVWYEDNLPQKASFKIDELFPGGPRSVSAAFTNSRSGVTVLFHRRTAYRFRWNKKSKRFHLAKNTPSELPQNITITPTVAFEWMDGNQVMLQGKEFVTYDAYWNLPTFSGETRRYFPNIPRDLIGLVYNSADNLLMYTKNNKLKLYSAKKYRVVQEYPIKINEYVGCL